MEELETWEIEWGEDVRSRAKYVLRNFVEMVLDTQKSIEDAKND